MNSGDSLYKMIRDPATELRRLHPAVFCETQIKITWESNAVFWIEFNARKNNSRWNDFSICAYTLQGCNRCFAVACYLEIASNLAITANLHSCSCLQWKPRFIAVIYLVCGIDSIFYTKIFKTIKPSIIHCPLCMRLL